MDDVRKTLRDRHICVVIPTYNNGGTIARVVADTQQYCNDVIVVDDGSTDTTSKELASISGITVVHYAKNRGKGYALKQGFRKALSLGFSYAITLDGDGQHYPCHIVDFLHANQAHPGALIIGNRNLSEVERSKGSSFANKFSNFWFFVQTGKRLSDTQSGYRLYPLKKLHGLSLLTNKYEAELELLVFPSWHGVELVSIPIEVYYPPQEERVSHFRPGKDFTRISVLNTVLCVLALVYGLPLRLFRFLAKWGRTIYAMLVFVILMLFIITPYVWVITKVGKMTEKKRKKLHGIIYNIARFFMLHHGIPGTHFTNHVAEDVNFEQPHVIICNHQSHLDLLCQLIFTPNIIFLTNDWVWKNPFYGLLIRNAEYYPVADGIDSLLPKLRSLTERGYSIALYPEGTRSKDCRIGRFHKGAFYIAEQLGLDILPMCLYGTGRVLRKGTHHLNKGPIHIEVDSPILRDTLQKQGDLKQQASWMRKKYRTWFEKMSNRFEC
ncbi:MAG: glycosyltransferase [Prevotella sp.]|nr:glycosyltransferase [Prevotella sp.]